MQCPRCQFENLPGQGRCFKCGSILADSGATITIEPPRLAGWRRPLRAVARSIRGHMPERFLTRKHAAHPRQIGESLAAVLSLGSLALGLIPGLPFWLTGQFKQIQQLWLAWLVLACVGMSLYGLTMGYLLIGLAIAIHAWLAFSHRALGVLEGLGERVVVLLILVLILFAAYVGTPRILIPGLQCVRSNMAIPSHRIQEGDALLARRAPRELKRGMVVLFAAWRWGVPRGYGATGGVMGGAASLGQIVGVPGDEVSIGLDGFVVNGQPLDARQYPLPRWLRGRRLPIHTVPSERYFVNCEYQGGGRIQNLDPNLIRTLCMVGRDRIESRAFMLWWPLSRRAFLRAD
jgi:hypothetical protein